MGFTPLKIFLKKISNQHLTNRIKYFERKLLNMPGEEIYVGDSVYAEDAVEAENTHNKCLAENIKKHIFEMKKELKEREVKK